MQWIRVFCRMFLCRVAEYSCRTILLSMLVMACGMQHALSNQYVVVKLPGRYSKAANNEQRQGNGS